MQREEFYRNERRHHPQHSKFLQWRLPLWCSGGMCTGSGRGSTRLTRDSVRRHSCRGPWAPEETAQSKEWTAFVRLGTEATGRPFAVQ
jgi:hypothetical protein